MAETPSTIPPPPGQISIIVKKSSDPASASHGDDDKDKNPETSHSDRLSATRDTGFPPFAETKVSCAVTLNLATGESSTSSQTLSLHIHEESLEPSVNATVTGHKAVSIEHSAPRRFNSTPFAQRGRRQINLPDGSSSFQSRKQKAPTLAGLSFTAADSSVLVQASMAVKLPSHLRSVAEDKDKDEHAEASGPDSLPSRRDTEVPPISETEASAASVTDLMNGDSCVSPQTQSPDPHAESPGHSTKATVTGGKAVSTTHSLPSRHNPTPSAPNSRPALLDRQINLPAGSSSPKSHKRKAPSLASKGKIPGIRHPTPTSPTKKPKTASVKTKSGERHSAKSVTTSPKPRPEPLVFSERRRAIDMLAFILMQYRAGLMKDFLWVLFTDLSPLVLRGQFDEALEKEEFFSFKTRVPDVARHQMCSLDYVLYDHSRDPHHDQRMARMDKLSLRRDGRTAIPSSLTHDDEFF
ncbi:hypothetical protein BD410DRAFT_829673 [Rickenella mellea]|uniref:Uncharacterized protein n=1 Tax=Rickenella mellea TaxID=50990 RepID=A0A4Y7PZ45_9AGAM|nr:hypothetical protein BD410DRAFT_829673 [Rickenella mellea]